MLNVECAKNRPAKNSMTKNRSLASEVIGHIGWGETAKNRKF